MTTRTSRSGGVSPLVAFVLEDHGLSGVADDSSLVAVEVSGGLKVWRTSSTHELKALLTDAEKWSYASASDPFGPSKR